MSLLKYSKEIARLNPKKRSTHRCKVCKFWTRSMISMVNHIRRHEQGIQPFRCENPVEEYHCDDCNFRTGETMLLKKHLQECHLAKLEFKEVQTYLCKNCDFQSNFLLDWFKHVVVNCASNGKTLVAKKSRNPWRKCEQCKYQTNKASCLKQHRVRKHLRNPEVQWLECDKCDYKCKATTLDLTKHVEFKHTGKDEDFRHKCDQCAYKSTKRWILEKHKKNKHLNPDASDWFQCDHCAYKTKVKCYLKTHTKLKHLSNDEVQWINCELCDFKTKLKTGLNRHMKMRHLREDEIRWWKCEQCEYKTKYKADLSVHMLRMHVNSNEVQWWTCYCGYKAKLEKDLLRHRKRVMHITIEID